MRKHVCDVCVGEGDVETSRRWLVDEWSALIGWWSQKVLIF